MSIFDTAEFNRLIAQFVTNIPQHEKDALTRARRAAAAGYWPEHDRLMTLTVAELKKLTRSSRFSTRGCVVKADWVRVIMSDWLAKTYFAAGYERARYGGMFPAPPRNRRTVA